LPIYEDDSPQWLRGMESIREDGSMKAWLVPLLLVALVASISSAQTPSATPERAATLRPPVPQTTIIARGATAEEDRKERYRQMKQRAAEDPTDRYSSRRSDDSFTDRDDRPIRRVSKEELWDYLDGPPPKFKPGRDDRDIERDPYLSDRDRDRDRDRGRSSSNKKSRSSRDRYDDDSWESNRFGDKIRDWMDFEKPGGWLESDPCFPGMATPVSNPFYFEDPRSTTEIRPLFIYQKIPSVQPNFNGGNIWYLGTQVRIAFTERISLTINKLGATAVNPENNALFSDSFGFSEFWLGPKVTIIRDEEFGTLLAAGAQFQIPTGQGKVFQNTGSLSIVPYVSLAQPFLKTRLGTFNGLVNTGYSISTNNRRSDFYYLNAHTSFDLGNAHRIFPLAELTWTRYTTNGTSWPIVGEGRDLINFGGMAKGNSLLTGALGARFRITKNADIGGAFELPLAGDKDFFQHRFTLDFIWRY
jgi:hypothetical protein